MNAPTPEAGIEHLLSVESNVDEEIGKLSAQEQPSAQIENNAKQKIEIGADRIRSSIARLTANSIGELEGLASELQKLEPASARMANRRSLGIAWRKSSSRLPTRDSGHVAGRMRQALNQAAANRIK